MARQQHFGFYMQPVPEKRSRSKSPAIVREHQPSFGYLQRASPGLRSFWIFYYNEEADNLGNQTLIKDLHHAGFEMCYFFNTV